jgi:hypothetical protein
VVSGMEVGEDETQPGVNRPGCLRSKQPP